MTNILLLIPTESGGPGPPQGIDDIIEVEYPTSFGTSDFLLRCVVALDASSTSLPDLYIDGIRAEVRGMTRDQNGNWELVEAIRKVPHKTPTAGMIQYTLTEDGSDGVASVFNDDLSTLQYVWHLAGLGNFGATARLIADGTPAVVLHDGVYMTEHRYWSRFRETSGPNVMGGVHTILTRRSDVPVYVFDTLITTGCYDRDGNPFNIQSDAGGAGCDGEAFFRRMELVGVPAGWSLMSAIPRLCEDFSATPPLLFRPLDDADPDAYQWMFPGTICRRIWAICPPGFEAQMREILDLYGHGRTLGTGSGPASFYNRRVHQAEGMRLARITNDYDYQGSGANGLPALRAFYRDQVAGLRQVYLNGTGALGGLVNADATGWSHPNGFGGGGTGTGTTAIDQTVGEGNIREELLWRRDYSMLGVERSRTGMFHYADGSFVTSHELANNNSSSWLDRNGNPAGGQSGFFPWTTFTSTMAPQLQVPQLSIEGNNSVTERLAPTNRPWNTLPGGATSHKSQVEVFNRVGSTHLCRNGFNDLRASAWQANDQMAVFLLQTHWNYYAYGVCHHGVRGFIRNGGQRHWQFVDIPFAIQWILSDPARQNAGGAHLNRDSGWQLNLFGTVYAWMSDQERALELARAQSVAALFEENATPLGFQIGDQIPAGVGGVHPYDENVHGCTNIGAGTGAFPDNGTFNFPMPGPGLPAACSPQPTEPIYHFVQNHTHSYLMAGAWCIVRRIVGGGVDAGATTSLEKTCKDLLVHIWAKYTPPATAAGDPQWHHITAIDGVPAASYIDWATNHDESTSIQGADGFRGGMQCLQMYLQTEDIVWLDHALQWLGVFDTGAGPGAQDYDKIIERMMSNPSELKLALGLAGEAENLP